MGQCAKNGYTKAGRLTLVVQHKAVCEHALVGRVAVGGDAGQQGALEPAAVLVRALQLWSQGGTGGCIAVCYCHNDVVAMHGRLPA